MGMRVIAVDGGEDKGKMCKELGAEEYIDFQNVKDIPAKVMEITTVLVTLQSFSSVADGTSVWSTRCNRFLGSQTRL